MIHTIIVPDSLRTHANQAAHLLGIDPSGTLDTLCVPLVPVDGPEDAAPTHWGACGSIPEAARAYLAANLEQFPGAMWWRWDDSGTLAAAHDSQHIGTPCSWDLSLLTAGVKRRIVPHQLS